MWSDNEADIDLLGFGHLESAVLAIVRDTTLLPASIGIYGDWGSGKSSLMRMVREELKKDDSLLVLSFNGWLFEGYEDAKTALMGTIVEEIVARRALEASVLEPVKRLGLKLLKKIQIFRLLGIGARAVTAYAIGGAPAAGAALGIEGTALLSGMLDKAGTEIQKIEEMKIEDVQAALKTETDSNLRRSIREFRDEFEALLDATKIKTLVVLIDDLDRCMPDTIIETLEAIKLFLFVPRTAFILGADERLVRYAVRRRFPEIPGEKVEVGQDYLEKLVQYPVRVPPMGRSEMETYINLLFTKNAGVKAEHFEAARRRAIECLPDDLLEVRFNHGIAQQILGKDFPNGLAESLSLAQRIAPVLAAGLTGNPRQCKRFLNTLVMRIEMAKSRGISLKLAVLAKLMLLERFYTESYKQLARLQAEQNGRPVELVAAEQAARPMPANTAKADVVDDTAVNDSTKRGGASQQRAAAPAIDLPDWLADQSLKDWLSSEPPLAGEDMRPYFYFSRDKLGSMGSSMQRMSPAAQDIVALLFREGKAQRKLTLKQAKDLSLGDANAVLQVLAERVQQEEDPGREDSALMCLLDWVDTRRELFGQGMAILNDLPETTLPVSVPPRIAKLAESLDERKAAERLLDKWARGDANARLKSAATSVLKRIKGA